MVEALASETPDAPQRRIYDPDELRCQESALALIERHGGGELRPGSNGRLHGRCPFPHHEDRKPSFALFPDGGYTCSCGTGDIIRLSVELRNETWTDRELPRYERELREALGMASTIVEMSPIGDRAAETVTTVTADASPIGKPVESRTATTVAVAASSWAPVDLGRILEGEQIGEPPTMLPRTDDVRLFYRGKLHTVQGEPESGKGWLLLRAVADELQAGEHVIYIDFEDGPETIVERLVLLGVERETIRQRLHYVNPDEPVSEDAWAALESALACSPSLIVLDGYTEALALHNLSIKDNDDIAKWGKLVPRRLLRTGAAVVQIDHVAKDRETRRQFGLGAQHKLAGVDVAYGLEAVEPLGRGREGLVRLTVAKDRPGYVRQYAADGKRIADMHVSSGEDGSVEVRLEPPPESSGTFRPTHLMGQVSEAIEASPGLTTKRIRAAVSGKGTWVDTAVERLIAEGYVERRKSGMAYEHYTLKPYREAEDEGA